MFSIGWPELAFIIIVAILVMGPEELPRLLRLCGRYAGRARRIIADFQASIEEATHLDELKEAKEEFNKIGKFELGSDQTEDMKQTSPSPEEPDDGK